jgi:hypothetical protein
VATVVDDDAASVVIASYNNVPTYPNIFEPIVVEGTSGPAQLQTDNFWVVLSKRPTGTVHVNLGYDPLQLQLSSSTITFDQTNWNKPVQITVSAIDDPNKEGTHYSRITTTIAAADLNNFLGITIADVANGTAAAINGNLDSPFTASVDPLNPDQIVISARPSAMSKPRPTRRPR